MRKIELTKGKVVLVDDIDYESLIKFKWHFGTKYAVRQSRGDERSQKTIYMHRQILGLSQDRSIEVDHINGNGLDNQRANLRIVTKFENQWNSKQHKKSKPYKGTYFHRASGKWSAETQHLHKRYYLGLFNSELEAAKAYDDKTKELCGEYAKPNFLL